VGAHVEATDAGYATSQTRGGRTDRHSDWMLLNESEVGGGVVDAGNTLVLTEVDGENIAGGRGRGASWVGAKVHADRDTLRLAEPA
jgi:hypothetical protein